jgi:hypothetical protein
MRQPRHPHHHDSPFGGRHWEKAWFAGPPWGGGRRARRGDVRTALLSLLADNPMHGYDLIRELEQRSGGAWRPSPGSIYPDAAAARGRGARDERGAGRQARVHDHRRGPSRARGAQGARDRGAVGVRAARRGASDSSARPGASSRPRPCRSRGRVRRPSASTPAEILAEARKKIYTLLAETEEDASLRHEIRHGLSVSARRVTRELSFGAWRPGTRSGRRNVRTYEDRAIPTDDLDRILEAGRRTPSSMNQQAWDFRRRHGSRSAP